MSSSDGTGTWPAILFAVIAWTDYADGIAARITGQYSRLGTLIDPIADRLLIIAGIVVCWKFDLLPRWALAVLVAREMRDARAGALRPASTGVDIAINWPGRLAVWPVMTAIFMALVELLDAAEVSLYIGLGLSLLSLRDVRAESGLRSRALNLR